MSARWAPHWQLLSAGWRMSGRWSAFRLLTAGLLLFGLACLAGTTPLVQNPGIGRASTGLSVVPLVLLWLLYSTTLMRFNHPVDARLVPRQLRCLRETLSVMWLAFAVVAGTAVVLAVGLPSRTIVWIMLLAAACALLPLLFIRWPWLLLLGWLAWLASDWLGDPALIRGLGSQVISGLDKLLDPIPEPLVALVALFALARLLTHGILRAGGNAHTRQFRSSPLGSAKPLARSGALLSDGWINGMRQLNRRQRAALSRSQGTSGSVLQRVAGMRLDAGAEWWRLLLVYAFVVLVVCSGLWFESEPTATLSLGIACIWAVAMPLITRSMLMAQSSKEHALWMLLPGMPQGIALNRSLAQRFLKNGLINWAGVALLSTAPSFFPPATHPWDGTWQSLVVIGLLPSVVFAINDWSRLPLAPTALQTAGGLLRCAIGPLLCIAAFVGLGAPVWLLGLCSVLVTVLASGWYWRQLAHYPAALPAGRLQ